MKNKLFYLGLAFIPLMSCTDSLNVKEESNLSLPAVNGQSAVYYPKSSVSRSSISNGYWEDWHTITLNSGDPAIVPWEIGASTSIPKDIRSDIKAENGWEIIAHTINTSDKKQDVGLNYIIFYNKFTGILKGFYYLEDAILQNTGIWELIFEQPCSFLAFSPSLIKFSDDKSTRRIYLSNITNDESKGFSLGWNCFQTELAYDPDFTDGTLQIIPYSLNYSKFTFTGQFESSTEGTIISTTSSNILDSGINEVATSVGEQSEEWVSKAIKTKNVFKKIGDTLIKGAGSIFTSGISSLLGSFVGGFNQQHETVQSVELKTTGNLEIEGSSSSVATGAIHPLTMSLSVDKVGKLGIWSLKRAPYLWIDPYAIHYKQDNSDPRKQYYRIPPPSVNITELYDIVEINPDILPYIENYEIKGHVYESLGVTHKDAMEEGIQGVYCQARFGNSLNRQLCDSIYEADYLYSWVFIKDQNGEPISNLGDNSPVEIYLPITEKGENGASPHVTFDLNNVLNIEVVLTINSNNTVVSGHTCAPKFKWNYDIAGDWYYSIYPFVPFEQSKVSKANYAKYVQLKNEMQKYNY